MNIYEDDRGKIIDVTDMEFHGLQIIHSKKGSVRSNHYHKKGGHLLYVVSGKMKYEEYQVGDAWIYVKGKTEHNTYTEKTINAGESVFTGPMTIHKTTFLEDTVLVCCSTMKRTDGAYEEDLVRCEL
jgi:quercetin dioxygenase-like cupin family protein